MSLRVICDQCGNDLSYTGNSEDFRISLRNERIPSKGGFVTDMMIYPPLKKDAHLCGIACLKAWVEKL